jgi:3-isopropylmalate/(R)-2-methylmalate dehydratase large subunit
VTSPQAFEGLRATGRKVHAPEKTLAVVDHNVPTTDRSKPNPDPESAEQIRVMAENAKEFGVEYYNEFDRRQGHRTRDRPRARFYVARHHHRLRRQPHLDPRRVRRAGAWHRHLEVEHVLATQTLIQKKAKNMRAVVDGKLPDGVTGKDIILAIIGEIGTAGGTGYVLEYAGDAIRALSMEGRMTVCNMSIEGGARAGLVAPDRKGVRVSEGPPEGAEGRGLGRRDALLGDAAKRRRRAFRSRDQAGCGKAAADRDLGDFTRGRRVDHRRRSRSRQDRGRGKAALRSIAR